MYDVVVIGGGLAGITTALAAKKRGAKVALATRSYGATALSTGAIDIAYTPALSPAQQNRTIAEHVMDIIAHRHRHPYGVLGVERTVRGLRAGYDLVASALEAEGVTLGTLDLERENVGLASTLGCVVPAAAALPSHLGLDLGKPLRGRVGILQLLGDASASAKSIARGVAFDAESWTGVTPALEVIEVDGFGGTSPFSIARRFDDAASVDALARALAPKIRGLTALLVPPVIGVARHAMMLSRLRDALGIPVIEMLAHAPSVPGFRFMQALERAARAARIDFVGEVTRPIVEGGVVRAVDTSFGLPTSGGAFVLATGRFIAGGVGWDAQCAETVFGLPVVSELGLLEEDSPDAVVQKTPVESHPLMTAGVQVDEALRPMREGRVAYGNLFAAGMVIGGFASRYALCADGVAIATGFLASEGAWSR